MPPLHVQTGLPTHPEIFKTVPSMSASLAALSQKDQELPQEWLKSPLYVEPSLLEPPTPNIDILQHRKITESFRAFRKDIEASGLYENGHPTNFKVEISRVLCLAASFFTVFYFANNWWHYLVSAFFLGLTWHQAMFVAHDAGHTEITGSQVGDKLIGSFIASWSMGMSLGWWSDQHNVHHLVPNHPEHDPDVQLAPLFAFTIKPLEGLYSTYHNTFIPGSKAVLALVSIQQYMFYPIMLFARFSLIGKSYHYLATKAPSGWFKNYELCGIAFFYCWFSTVLYYIDAGAPLQNWILRVAFVLTALATTSPIHVQIVLSHSAQSSEDVGPYEAFAARQLRTTMDVACPAWMDFVHGGLHMQVAHHLFPRCPRPLLRDLTEKVKAWAAETDGVEFEARGFVSSNFKICNMLTDIAGQAKILQGVALQIKDGTLHLD